jgi:hypothetical protein
VYDWTIDTTAPGVTLDSTPSDPSSEVDPSFAFSASESATFECRLDGDPFGACSSPQDYSGLAEGAHTFRVRATDAAGNTGSAAVYDWVVDAAAPSVSITAPSGLINLADADPFTVTAMSPDGDVTSVEFFECTDSSSNCSTGSWVSLGPADTAAPYSASWSLPADGNSSLRAVATDAGSKTGEDTVDVTLDRTRPVSSIDSAPSDPTSSTTASFSFTASEASSFECELDGGGFTTCTSPWTHTSLADGSHTFHVRATDLAGNTEMPPAQLSWTVDTSAPAAPGRFRGSNKSGRLVLNWTPPTDAGLVDAYLVYTNGTLAATVDSATLSADMGKFSLGDSRSFQVAARDIAGNIGLRTNAIVIVPKLAKLTLAKAKSALVKRGLKLGKVSRVYSRLVKGKVISAGKNGVVAQGTAVPVKISKGPRP